VQYYLALAQDRSSSVARERGYSPTHWPKEKKKKEEKCAFSALTLLLAVAEQYFKRLEGEG